VRNKLPISTKIKCMGGNSWNAQEPFFIDGILTSIRLCFEMTIVLGIQYFLFKCLVSIGCAPPHFELEMRNFLNKTFSGSWIGRRRAIEWPSDLTPLDFFFWGYLKDRV